MIKIKRQNKILIVFLIILIIIYILIKTDFISKAQDDILFLKFLNLQSNNSETSSNKEIINSKISKYEKATYVFEMKNHNTDFKDIDLSETINEKTLINEKIAPGVSGKFNIVLRTNQNTIYEVKFKSKTQKPQNLKFEIENTNIKANNLEELENYLKGRINKGEEKTISIKWSWEYENSIKNNIQDTKDAMKIESYKFEIFATGEEII